MHMFLMHMFDVISDEPAGHQQIHVAQNNIGRNTDSTDQTRGAGESYTGVQTGFFHKRSRSNGEDLQASLKPADESDGD